MIQVSRRQIHWQRPSPHSHYYDSSRPLNIIITYCSYCICASFSLFLSKTSDHTMWQDTKYSNFPQDYIRFKTCSLLMEFYKDYNKRWKQTTEWRKERASTILCNPAHISTGVSESITSCNGVTLSVTTQTSSDNRATSWNLTMHGCRNLFNHYM